MAASNPDVLAGEDEELRSLSSAVRGVNGRLKLKFACAVCAKEKTQPSQLWKLIYRRGDGVWRVYTSEARHWQVYRLAPGAEPSQTGSPDPTAILGHGWLCNACYQRPDTCEYGIWVAPQKKD